MKLAPCIRQFFDQYLPHIKGVSEHTVQAYRDAFRLFLPFAAKFYNIKNQIPQSGASLVGVNYCFS